MSAISNLLWRPGTISRQSDRSYCLFYVRTQRKQIGILFLLCKRVWQTTWIPTPCRQRARQLILNTPFHMPRCNNVNAIRRLRDAKSRETLGNSTRSWVRNEKVSSKPLTPLIGTAPVFFVLQALYLNEHVMNNYLLIHRLLRHWYLFTRKIHLKLERIW